MIWGWAVVGFFGGFSADITLKGGPMALADHYPSCAITSPGQGQGSPVACPCVTCSGGRAGS